MFEVWIWMVLAAVFVLFITLTPNGKGRGFRNPSIKAQYQKERDHARDDVIRDRQWWESIGGG